MRVNEVPGGVVRRYTPELVTSLEPHQVFVFGSNKAGFHGAGAAGLAFRGQVANTWRQDPLFVAAMSAATGAQARVGRWAVYGVARGLQSGHLGQSYAIVTVERPGLRRSIPPASIGSQIEDLCLFAGQHPEMEFLVTKIGCGLAGYSEGEIRQLFVLAQASTGVPDNVLLPQGLEFR